MNKFYPVSVLTLIVTDRCNLACKYCYCDHTRQRDMSPNILYRSLEAFTNTKDKVRICFFGGEPFMAFNQIKDVVKYVEDNKINASFHVTTNCTLITPTIAKYLKEKRFSIIASIDGPEKIHNKMRKYKNGKGSHKSTLKGMGHLRKAGIQISVLKATYGPDDTHLMERMIYLTELLEQGYARHISIEPYSNPKLGCNYRNARNFTVADIATLKSEYFDVCDYVTARIKNKQPASFRQIQGIAKRLVDDKFYFNECGAGVNIATIGTDGTIYACHRQSATEMGSVFDGVDNNAQKEWQKSMVEMPKMCLDCDIYMLCGGPCKEQSLHQGYEMNQPEPVLCAFKHLWIDCGMRMIRSISREKIKEKCGKCCKQKSDGFCSINT